MNNFGNIFRLSIYGESHSEVIGVIIDGVPAGISLCPDDFEDALSRRRSGNKGTTPRIEKDIPLIKSGVYQGFTTGSPICIEFQNNNTKSSNYQQFTKQPRPGHSDYVANIKFKGFNDPRGGGAFSGRLSLALVVSGVVAQKVLEFNNLSISAQSQIISLGGEEDKTLWDNILNKAIQDKDSLGAIVECKVSNMPIGLGEPFFDSIESLASHLIFSIPGVRGVEFGDGFKASAMRGSQHNDCFTKEKDGVLESYTNGSGGINGGLSNGSDIICRVSFKPTSSIGKTQKTFNLESKKVENLNIKGRHDVCFALRAGIIVESALYIILADLFLRNKALNN